LYSDCAAKNSRPVKAWCRGCEEGDHFDSAGDDYVQRALIAVPRQLD
jgi:hypothetical protein